MKKFKWIILGLAVISAAGCTIDITPRGSYYYDHGYCDDYYHSPGYIYVETRDYGYHGHHGHRKGYRKRCR